MIPIYDVEFRQISDWILPEGRSSPHRTTFYYPLNGKII